MKKTRLSKMQQDRMQAWEEKFLNSLRRTGNVSRACKAAGIGRMTAYDQYARDEKFSKQWDDAIAESADWLEREAWRRAVKGVDKPVYQQGSKVGTVREYSDTLLCLLLKANKPKKFRENTKVEVSGENGGAIETKTTHSFDLSGITDDELVKFERAFSSGPSRISTPSRN